MAARCFGDADAPCVPTSRIGAMLPSLGSTACMATAPSQKERKLRHSSYSSAPGSSHSTLKKIGKTQ